jgi:sulfur carrier protein ThiS
VKRFEEGIHCMEKVKMLRVTIKISSTLKDIAGENSLVLAVPVNSSVREVLNREFLQFEDRLKQRYGFRDIESFLKSFIILLNGASLSKTDSLDTEVGEGDIVEIMELISGG